MSEYRDWHIQVVRPTIGGEPASKKKRVSLLEPLKVAAQSVVRKVKRNEEPSVGKINLARRVIGK